MDVASQTLIDTDGDPTTVDYLEPEEEFRAHFMLVSPF
jgi:hypothetical protein